LLFKTIFNKSKMNIDENVIFRIAKSESVNNLIISKSYLSKMIQF